MWITQKGYEVLLKKLDNLNKKKKNLLAQLGEQAERDSDLPENPIWKQMQVELRFNLPKQIAELQKVAFESQIIEGSRSQLKKQPGITLGTKATIKIDEEEKQVIVVVGPYDIDVIENGISYLSPLGKALLGMEEGEEKIFVAPRGNRQIKVLSITKETL
jgi:transcription elongation factor GreA